MAPLVKPPTEGDILKFDLDKNYTREVVTLLEGTNFPIGAVLGRVAASGKYKLSAASGSDGAETAAGVLVEAVDASDGDRTGVIVSRGPAIVAGGMLVFDPSVDDAAKRAAKIAELVALGIVARDTA